VSSRLTWLRTVRDGSGRAGAGDHCYRDSSNAPAELPRDGRGASDFECVSFNRIIIITSLTVAYQLLRGEPCRKKTRALPNISSRT
jgi:hypothetical protein